MLHLYFFLTQQKDSKKGFSAQQPQPAAAAAKILVII